MVNRGQLKAIWAFYKHYSVSSILFTLFCAWLFWEYDALFQIMFIKLATGWLIWYFIISFHSQKLFYYYNLHVHKRTLWGGYFFIDFFVLVFILVTIRFLK